MKRNSFTKEQIGKLRRLERAKSLLDRKLVVPIFGEDHKFVCFSSKKPVTGPEGIAYLVDLAAETCTCPDFQQNKRFNGGWCKHKMAAFLLKEHPDDYQDWLPPWARGKEREVEEVLKQKRSRNGSGKLDKALAELPDEDLERLIKLATAEQMDRDYERAVSKDA